MDKAPTASDWDNMPYVRLSDVVTGEQPALQTHVRLCWTSYALHLQFRCEDDCIVSPYTKRDEPLFDADVVEWFIQPSAEQKRYYEFNISPHNVIFDSMIEYEGKEKSFHPEWDAKGVSAHIRYTEPDRVFKHGSVRLEYTAILPYADLGTSPQHGDEWRINMFRIDQNTAGERFYSAWSPTGAVNFHVPELFGCIRFLQT